MSNRQTATVEKDVREVAVHLAKMHKKAEPKIKEIYFFPGADEIRLIELDPTASPSEEITPYYFHADPANGVPYVSAIALIRPEERRRLRPPQEWGNWQDAEKIWPPASIKHGQ